MDHDPDAPRRLTPFVRWIALAAMAVVGAAPIVAGLAVADRLEAGEHDADVAFTSVVALAPADARRPLLEASQRRAWEVTADGNVQPLTADAVADADERWHRRIAFGVAQGDRRFTTLDPSGREWSHVAAPTPDGDVLVGARPMSDVTSEGRRLMGILAVVGLVGVVTIGALWFVLQRRVVRPVQVLLAAGDELRVRGSIRPEVGDQVERIAPTPRELHQLGHVLRTIEADTHRAFGRAENLLQAAGALGGSLDLDEILESTLDHLHRLLQVDSSSILRYDARLEAFEIVAVRGRGDDDVREYVRVVTARGHDATLPSVRALRERVPVQVPDTEAEVVSPALRDRGRRLDYRGILAVPLTAPLEHPTVLLLHTRRPHTFSYDEVVLSRSFASIAGAALSNAELFGRTDARLREQTSQLQAIVESVDEGLLVETVDGRLVFANSAMRRLLPGDRRPIEGRPTTDWLDDLPVSGISMRGTDAVHASADDTHHDVELLDPTDGSTRTFRVRGFVVRDSHGVRIGRGQTWLDVSRDRQLEQMKSSLLATVSHEFRTPLALIKGYASTLLADDVTWHPDDEREFLRLVSAEADRLSDLVQGLLDMRRIDAGMVELQVMSVALGVVIDSTLDALPQYRPRIDVGPVPDVTVEIDAARIVTALRNLIENACKYSPPDRRVDLSVSAGASELDLTVRDRGPGIDPALADQMFETFVRGQTGLVAEHSGIGLGLSIARGFVVAHGGRLWFQPPAAGPGAEFHIALPVSSIRHAMTPVGTR